MPTDTLDPQAVNLAKAIRQTESGGNFTAHGKSGEFGAYQFTPDTWNKYASEAGVNTPLSQATPEQQNEVAYKKIKAWKDQGNNVGQIASMWNAGEGKANAYLDPNFKGVNKSGVSFNTPAYAKSVATAYQTLKGGGQVNIDPQNPSAIGTQYPQEQSPSVGGFLGNVVSSGANLIGGVGNAIMHPIQTAENLGKVAIGGVEKLIPGQQGQEQNFDQLAQFYKERYGGLGNVAHTLYTDPVGAAMDASVLLGGAGAITSGIGKVADVGRLGEIGGALSRAGEVANPISAGLKAIPLGKRFAPFGKSYDTETAGVFEKYGVKAPASAITTSKAVPVVESLASKGLLSGNKVVRMIDDANTSMQGIAEQTLSTAGTADPVVAGQIISKNFNKFVDTFNNTKTQLYDIPGLKSIPAEVTNTEQVLKNIVGQKAGIIGGSQDVAYFQNKLDALSKQPEGLTFDNLKQTRTEVGGKLKSRTDPFTTGNKAQLEQLYSALSSDMDEAIKATGNPNLAGALEKANAYYKQGLTQINSSYGKLIKRFANQPDKITQMLIRPTTSIEDIPRIFTAIGPEGQDALRGNILNSLFTKSKNPEGFFSPGGISRQIKSYGEDKLKAILTPEQYGAVADLDTMSQAMGKTQRVMAGSQTGFLNRIVAEGFFLGISPWNAIKAVLGDAIASKIAESDWGQALMTKGVNVGGKLGTSFRNNIPTLTKVGNVGRLGQVSNYVSPTSK